MCKKIYLFAFLFYTVFFYSQIGIGTVSPEAVLDVKSSSSGVLIPRITDTLNISVPKSGMLIFESTVKKFAYFNGLKWIFLSDSSTKSHGAVKVNANQSNWVSLSGTQTYEQLLINQTRTVSPTYVTGAYSSESDSPDDILKPTIPAMGAGYGAGALLENPVNFQGHNFRINMEFKLSSSPSPATGAYYFYIRIKSRGSGAIVYANSYTVPGNLSVGSVIPIQAFFSTIADAASIGSGYNIEFQCDGTLANKVDMLVKDVVRIN